MEGYVSRDGPEEDTMTDTKQKPDGWVAVNKDGWIYWDNVSLSCEEEVFSKIVGEMPYGQNFESLSDYEAAVDEAKRQGWKARPFVFLDEGEK